MGNSESRPSPGEDVHHGRHGGDRDDIRRAEAGPGRSSQAAGKDPGRTSGGEVEARRPQEDRTIDAPRSGPPEHSTDPGAGPPGTERHVRGWREDDPAADSALPGRESGAGGGKIDGPQR